MNGGVGRLKCQVGNLFDLNTENIDNNKLLIFYFIFKHCQFLLTF